MAKYFKPENNDFSPIEITEEMDFDIWGCHIRDS